MLLFPLLAALQLVSSDVCEDKLSFTPSSSTYEFELMELPYSYAFLEPFLTAEIIYAHHDHHHQTYVDKLNTYIADHPDLGQMTLVDLVLAATEDTTLQKHAGGAYNHNLYWYFLTSPICAKGAPEGPLSEQIVEQWGSFEAFVDDFTTNQKDLFGSGWVWACVNGAGAIEIRKTANQINPLMQVDSDICYPFLGNDIWEHAYYLKYMWERADYIDYYFKAIDWDIVEMFYEEYASQLIAVPI